MANRELKTLTFSPDRCTGCRICEEACVTYHYDEINLARSRIRVIRDDDEGLDIVTVCVQCEEKPCIPSCPVEVISANDDGTITIDDFCIECNLCKDACLYSGTHPDPKGGKYIVCDLCDGDPQCVQWCPFDVIQYTEEYNEEKDERHKELINLIERK
ncbi:MAG: 4Fe-4S dicluster domain-containing protein [Promethearchaeota archaeon]